METARLRLRQWKAQDREAFRLMGADPQVMRYFPALLSHDESDAMVQRIFDIIDQKGWGFWAVELKETREFIGFVGLHQQAQDSGIPNAPLVEIGWRLAQPHWGKGYAPEAAQAALKFAFEQLNLDTVYAFTALPNQPSQQVMMKLGVKNLQQDFNHPKLPQGHPLQRHCLYAIKRSDWR
ncbi:GNAT family N-acetyltransferase [Vibrio sp. TRT 17S01]|uniref:GNAT family N-acetyltransferase n=1 Tax=Vibrio sp. TRT 17S01 TaxID=3418505 RepID=UPI003CE78D2A